MFPYRSPRYGSPEDTLPQAYDSEQDQTLPGNSLPTIHTRYSLVLFSPNYNV